MIKKIIDWTWRTGLSVGGFLVAMLMGGLLVAPLCHGRDIRAAVFIGIPLCLMAFGTALRFWDLCRRPHILSTVVVFFSTAVAITLNFEWNELHEILYWSGSASLVFLLPWIVGLLAGQVLRRGKKDRDRDAPCGAPLPHH